MLTDTFEAASICEKLRRATEEFAKTDRAYTDLMERIDEKLQEAWDEQALQAESQRIPTQGASMHLYDVEKPAGKISCYYF
jgi:hypothetical protein